MSTNRPTSLSPLRTVLLGLVALLLLSAIGLGQTQKAFVVTQSIHTYPPPDLSADGVQYQPIIYENALFSSPKDDAMHTDQKLKSFASQWNKGPLPTVVDIERWPVTGQTTEARAESVRKLVQSMERVRQLRPDLKFGFYGVIPDRVYWPLVASDKIGEKARWQHENALSQKDLAPYVDAIYPSLYAFYPDQKGWEKFAVETLQAARQFGKPVYCFLWPELQNKTHDRIGAEYWRLQLNTCRKYADGIVLYDQNKFDSNEAWWKETQKFLTTLRAQQPAPATSPGATR